MNYLTFSTKADAKEQKDRWVNEGFTRANIVRMKNGLYAVIADPSPSMLAQPDYFSFAEEFGREIGREVDVPARIGTPQPEQQTIQMQQQPQEKKWYMPNFAGITSDLSDSSAIQPSEEGGSTPTESQSDENQQ